MLANAVEVDVTPAPKLGSGGGGDVPGGGDGGDGGGGGGGDDEVPISSAKLAMVFVLFSLSVLFVVSTFVALFLRRSAEVWQPGVVPAFPPVLFASTGVLVASSLALRRGVRAIGRGDRAGLRRGLGLATALGFGFLAAQGIAWRELVGQGVTMATGSYGTIFYWLTGLHGAHVVGGVVILAWCLVRAGRYTREDHVGVELGEIYWHFLLAVWLVLVALLWAML